MAVFIVQGDFNPWQEIQKYQNSIDSLAGKIGAACIFIGTMRDFNLGDSVKSMTLEHYPGMGEKQLEVIVVEAHQQWSILDSLVVHRVGDIVPKDAIVLVAVWSAHRGDAFDACRYIMEALKSRAPFWKKERLVSEYERWVAENTTGYNLV